MWLLGLACCSAFVAHAQNDRTALEWRVKAAFIFKFAGYAEWPEGTFAAAGIPVTVAVIGDDELATGLEQIAAGRAVEGRPLAVKRTGNVEAAVDAHMLFVGRSETARLPQLAKLARARAVLIISDAAGALSQGSMINSCWSSNASSSRFQWKKPNVTVSG